MENIKVPDSILSIDLNKYKNVLECPQDFAFKKFDIVYCYHKNFETNEIYKKPYIVISVKENGRIAKIINMPGEKGTLETLRDIVLNYNGSGKVSETFYTQEYEIINHPISLRVMAIQRPEE